MGWNFANEGEQTSNDTKYEPVPAGSVVVVEIKPQEAWTQADGIDDKFVNEAKSGLLRVRLQCTVAYGQYEGVKFFQWISLPEGMQRISLNNGQLLSCRIGGAQIKAMCQAASKPLAFRSFGEMAGWKIPVRVRIDNTPSEGRNGRLFWNNEIDRVLTKDDPEWAEIRKPPYEIINEGGAVTGTGTPRNSGYSGSESQDDSPFNDSQRAMYELDEPPF